MGSDFFRGARLFAFDLDGTLWLGERAVPGAVELVARLRRGHHVAFFTNNSAAADAKVLEKLQRLGFDARPGEVHTSASATARYLREAGLDDLYVVGSEGLRSEIGAAGLRVAGEDAARHVVAGLDRELSYAKVAAALAVLLRGGRFVACNEDARFPVGGGVFLPGCGAVVGAIAAAAGRRPDFVVGKPNTYLLALIAGRLGVGPREIVVVGDSPESDVEMARRNGSRAVLVGGGRAGDAGLLVVDDLGGLAAALAAGGGGG